MFPENEGRSELFSNMHRGFHGLAGEIGLLLFVRMAAGTATGLIARSLGDQIQRRLRRAEP